MTVRSAVSNRMSENERMKLMTELVNWKTCVEQVVLLLASRKDPDLNALTVRLIRWLENPVNVRKTQIKTLDGIIEELKNESATEVSKAEQEAPWTDR